MTDLLALIDGGGLLAFAAAVLWLGRSVHADIKTGFANLVTEMQAERKARQSHDTRALESVGEHQRLVIAMLAEIRERQTRIAADVGVTVFDDGPGAAMEDKVDKALGA
jgi:hypothetical protein